MFFSFFYIHVKKIIMILSILNSLNTWLLCNWQIVDIIDICSQLISSMFRNGSGTAHPARCNLYMFKIKNMS